MAKNEKNAAKAAESQNAITVENIKEQIESENKMEDAIVAEAEKELQKEKDDKKKGEMKKALVMAEYINKREVLQLRKRRAEEKITKETLTATKDNLDKLRKGELTPSSFTAALYDLSKQRRDEFNKVDEEYRKLVGELNNNFPSYYSPEWEYERWADGCRRPSWCY